MNTRLDLDTTALLVVDVQTRFGPAIEEFAELVERARRLIRTARLLELPVLATEQYPRGLGATVPELVEALGDTPRWAKSCFSAAADERVTSRLDELGCRSVVLVGVETHVCILQTALDLLDSGRTVHVVTDACGSRDPLDRDAAFHRLDRARAVLTTSETVPFELLRTAAHPQFKQVQALFK